MRFKANIDLEKWGIKPKFNEGDWVYHASVTGVRKRQVEEILVEKDDYGYPSITYFLSGGGFNVYGWEIYATFEEAKKSCEERGCFNSIEELKASWRPNRWYGYGNSEK